MRTASGAQRQDIREVVTVHMRRLGAGMDLDRGHPAARPGGLGLDIGMLDEAGFEFAFDDYIGNGERALDIARDHASAGEEIAPPCLMQEGRIGIGAPHRS